MVTLSCCPVRRGYGETGGRWRELRCFVRGRRFLRTAGSGLEGAKDKSCRAVQYMRTQPFRRRTDKTVDRWPSRPAASATAGLLGSQSGRRAAMVNSPAVHRAGGNKPAQQQTARRAKSVDAPGKVASHRARADLVIYNRTHVFDQA